MRRPTTALLALAAAVVAATLATASPASAAAPPVLWLDATDLDFGHVTLGGNSANQAVTVTNAGPGTATGIVVGAPTDPQMSITATTCGATLAAGSTCTVSYRYHPTKKEESRADATVTATGGTVATVSLTGLPDAAALSLRVTPTGHDFGPVAVGGTSATKAVVLTNTTGASAQFTLAGTAPTGPFTVASTSCIGSPVTLAAGASCSLNYRFSPSAPGPASGSAALSVTQVGVGTVPFPVVLRGHGGTAGAPVLTLSPFAFDFGQVAVGATSSSQSMQVTNTSGTTQTVTGLAGGAATNFGGVTACGGALAPGASCTLSWAATPPAAGLVTGWTNATYSIAGKPSQRAEITFTATGTGTKGRLVVSPRHINLGPSPVGTPTATKVVTLRNTGNATLTGIALSQLAPIRPQMTSTATTCGATLAAGAACTFSVRYTPTDAQAVSTIFSIANSSGAQIFSLDGGPIATVHQNFVRLAYIDFLDRLPTTTERSVAAGYLDAGATTRRAFVTTLAQSDEWIEALVQDLYQDTLGRDGDAGGVAFWVNRLRTGRNTVAQVAAQFYASNEYYNTIGGGTDTTWVSDLYDKLLGRSPDAGGLAYWVGQTASKGRASVSGRMFQSPESRRARVTKLYRQLLFRDPDPSGRTYWAGQIEAKGDIVLAIELASSTEFLRLAQKLSGDFG